MFTIIGGDGRQYGPVTADQLRAWIAAGRANLDTQAKTAESDEWRRLGDYPEFGGQASAPPLMPAPEMPRDTAPVEPAAPLAGPGTRIVAALINAFVYFMSMMPGAVAFGVRLVREHPEIAEGRVLRPDEIDLGLLIQGAAWMYAGLGIAMLVQALLIAWRGQNLGKLMLGLKVVQLDGSRAGFLRGVLVRYLVPVLVFLFLLNVFFPLALLFLVVDLAFMFRADRRCLHDLMAGTIVVRA